MKEENGTSRTPIETLKQSAIRTVIIPLIVPSHKNQLRPSKSGGMYLDMRARKQREALMLYLKSLTPIGEEWAVRCEMEIDLEADTTTATLLPIGLYDHKKHPDADGMATALLDAAQRCGILVNDNRVKQLWVEIK